MIDPHDSKRWDRIHTKSTDADLQPSVYAKEKEQLFPRNSIVCDLGGGTGGDAVYFLLKGHQVILFDISQHALGVAQKLAKANKVADKLQVRQVDFGYQELPLNTNSVDVVYSRISLNYFPAEQTVRIFINIFNVLKPASVAYISLKSPDDKVEMKRFSENLSQFEPQVYIDGRQLRSRFTLDKLGEIMGAAGILNVKITPRTQNLGVSKDGKPQTLYVNEVEFKKPA